MNWTSIRKKQIPIAINILILLRGKVFSAILIESGKMIIPSLRGNYDLELLSQELIGEVKYWMPRPKLP